MRDKSQAPHVRIGDDIWITRARNHHAWRHLENGAVLVAGAVVTEGVPPMAVVTDVPARNQRD